MGAIAGLLVWAAQAALASNLGDLLSKADQVKLSDHAEFMRLLKTVDEHASELSGEEREYFDYLQGYGSVYDGDYEAAVKKLTPLQDSARDITIRFRAGATVVNSLSLHKRYKESYSRLNTFLVLLPQVTNGEARQQGMLIAALSYKDVGQYKLSLRLAQTIIDENWAGKGVCKGGLLKLQVLYLSRKLQQVGPEMQAGIDACAKAGEIAFENAIPLEPARAYLRHKQYDEVIALLTEHYDDVVKSGYRRMISEYDSLLAQAYRGKSAAPMARKMALEAIQNTDADQFTEPLADAYSVLYELAKDQGDFKSALAFHEQYAAANRGYLDDESARHLAFQSVSRETSANQLEFEAQSEQSRESRLQRELNAKGIETIRLYVTLLVLIVAFVGFWVYRVRRLKLHLTDTSQFDS
jgi:hypothetical protein